MSDQSEPIVAVENEPAVVASADPAPAEPVLTTEAVEVEQIPASAVEIPADWAELHWKQVVVLAKQIAGNIDIGFDDAKRIISDELATRAATENDGLVPMTKNGDTLQVNPATVEAHKAAGWAIV
jgi:hypothetical protein